MREGELRYDVLLVSLAAAAGAVDVTSLLGLGQVFTANMSGNLVIFGLAIGGGAHAHALHSLAALLGFVAGAALGARLRGPRRRGVWSPGVVSALAVAALGELVVFAGWAASGGHPGPIAVYPLIASSATAMGAQSAAVRSLADVNTTYLTGTMTALIVDTETGRESEASVVRRVSVIVAFVAAAALAALLLRHARSLAPLVPVVLIGGVVVAAHGWEGRRRRVA